MKTLGVIGGLGPMATAYFMELVTKMTKAGCDQEHMQMIVYSQPTIPDRTAYILKKNPNSPVPEMTRLAKLLAPEGATVELALDNGVLLGGGSESSAAVNHPWSTSAGMTPAAASKPRARGRS